MIKTQLTLYMENRYGQLAQATRLLEKSKVNLEAISVAEASAASLVQIIVDRPRRAREVLKEAGIPVAEEKVNVVLLENKPGALAHVANRLARKKVNINYLYATTTPGKGAEQTAVVISADDPQAIEDFFAD